MNRILLNSHPINGIFDEAELLFEMGYGVSIIIFMEEDKLIYGNKTVRCGFKLALKQYLPTTLHQRLRSYDYPSKNIGGQFVVDYKRREFLLDGNPFRIVAAEIHYFRVPTEYWSDRLRKIKKSGCNAISTYVEWRSHEPFPGKFRFNGDLDLIKFIKFADAINLKVLLRIGPYIGSERDLGGMPSWILAKTKTVRESDEYFLKVVRIWWDKLLPMLKPLLRNNGGPVIMVQIENEYGFNEICDKKYLRTLKEMAQSHLGKDTTYYIVENPLVHPDCSQIEGVFPALNFGPDFPHNPEDYFAKLNNFRTPGGDRFEGPYFNAEFYTGWYESWGYPPEVRTRESLVTHMRKVLNYKNASISFYPFHGGTSFGLSTGAIHELNYGDWLFPTTSYDYGAPLDEAGDATSKYFAIRAAIGEFVKVPDIFVDLEIRRKMSFGVVKLNYLMDFFQFIQVPAVKVIETTDGPRVFELMNVRNGFVYYTYKIEFRSETSILKATLQDRAYVYVDEVYQGVMNNPKGVLELAITFRKNSVLGILVENQGRLSNANRMIDYRGIVGQVMLGGKPLEGTWTHYLVEDWEELFADTSCQGANGTAENLPTQGRSVDREESDEESCLMDSPQNRSKCAPVFMQSEFMIPESIDIVDTYFWPIDLTRGIVYLNGRCLGRYWPGMGPQYSLYVPGVWFNAPPKVNALIVMELEPKPCVLRGNCRFKFHKKPKGMEVDLKRMSFNVRSRLPGSDPKDSDGIPNIPPSASGSSSNPSATSTKDSF
ncbi:beta-galactosidase-like [Brevipalpus obovatus]|uniref:beta-galactosidase-like n=1 Tax=Brevipalpus obovatus TaxID=246614 RepID=UPI003D9DEEF9